jgi:HlyD family secretion protein
MNGVRRAAIAVAILTLVSACGREPPAGWSGYVEADYVRVAAPIGGRLDRLAVSRGDTVRAGAPLFSLDAEAERAARSEAEARVAKAQSGLANLEKARRPPEIAAARAQLAQAQATLRQAEADLARAQRLVADKFLAPQRLDDAVATRDRSRAQVAQLEAEVTVANLPARSDEIAAAKAEARAAEDALAQARWRVDQKVQAAPVAGTVADTLYRQGEFVPAAAPVVSILAPENVKVRFFVPETAIARLRVGDAVRIVCDGCGEPIAANVTFIAPEAEYTPPVIYSRENRAKLVFMVEARPLAPHPALRPGLPAEVVRAS